MAHVIEKWASIWSAARREEEAFIIRILPLQWLAGLPGVIIKCTSILSLQLYDLEIYLIKFVRATRPSAAKFGGEKCDAGGQFQ